MPGGGHYNSAALRAKVAEIQANIPSGVGLTLNALYINPRQFGFQLPLWQELRREGVPVEGFCVTAGIPSPKRLQRSSVVSRLPVFDMSRSSPDRSKAFLKSSRSPPPTPVSLSFFSGLVVVPVVTTHATTSISQSWRPAHPFVGN